MELKQQPDRRSRILIIEDDEAWRRLLARMLEREGYRVSTASNGAKGLEIGQEFLPDLIVLDLELPDINGFVVLEILRTHPLTSAIPVIIITGHPDPSDLLKTAAGHYAASHFLSKPFDVGELRRRVGKLLSDFAMKREHSILPQTVLTRGPLTLDLARQELRVGDRLRRLGPGQSALLYELMRHRGAVTRDFLLRRVWRGSENRSTVNMAVSRLRETLKSAAGVEIRAVSDGYELIVKADSDGV